MCELFGISSSERLQVNRLLDTFFSHGRTNPHGWGMAFFRGCSVSIEKQPDSSVDSKYLKQRLRAPVIVRNFMAHIRYATRGEITYENCHPFTDTDICRRNWTMIHNGTIYDFPKLSPYTVKQQGNTDSERIFLYMMDLINTAEKDAGRELTEQERFQLIDRMVCEMSDENKLNLIIFDGAVMYVHCNYRGSLYRSRRGGATVFSTRRLDNLSGKGWEPVPLNTLQGYRDGRLVYTGTDHGHEFFDTEEKEHMFFLDYAAL